MKRVRRLASSPRLLANYTDLDQDKDWDGFRDYHGGEAYQELIGDLVHIQHGLCGYCEIDLKPTDRQVEHVIPRSTQNAGNEHALDYTNMIACCTGGTSRNLFGPEAYDDEERFLLPSSYNISCGQAKGDRSEAALLDPRLLPAAPSLMRVQLDGVVVPDATACHQTGFSMDDVRNTIEILGLNVERLRIAREKRWSALSDNWNDYMDDVELLEAAARSELLPDSHGLLPRFFTTNRSYFDFVGELVLTRQPQSWI